MRTMTIKLTGVTPNRIEALHGFVHPEADSHSFLSTDDLIPDGAKLMDGDSDYPECRILKSVFSPDFGTYTVEIEVPISVKLVHEKHKCMAGEKVVNPSALDKGSVIHAGRMMLDQLIKALGLFPENEESLQKSEW